MLSRQSTWVLAVVAFALATSPVEAGSVVVGGQDGPWNYSNGGVNTNFQYGVGNQSAPTVITAANGFSFAAGSMFTISYISGAVSIAAGLPFFDANGDPNLLANNSSSINGVYPSAYIPPSEYPAYVGELVGTFANSSGSIVGTPFNIGDLRTVVVPAGATQLQLGINDNFFSDNTGSLTIQVSQVSAVPEPASILLAGIAVAIVGLWRVRR